jgi:hypothetical protein
VFDGLLPEPHNQHVLELLFIMAHWHGLAKLRMYTDTTLDILSKVTTSLGDKSRKFAAQTCSGFETYELERERAACLQRQQKNAEAKSETSGNHMRKPKPFNLKTHKFHALGDYVATIRWFGTTDSYSTQPVSLSDILCLYDSADCMADTIG